MINSKQLRILFHTASKAILITGLKKLCALLATCTLVKICGSYIGFVKVVRGIRTLYFTPGLYV